METQQEINAEISGSAAGRDIRNTNEVQGDCSILAAGGFHNHGTVNFLNMQPPITDGEGVGKTLLALGELLCNSEGKKLRHLDGLGALVSLIGADLMQGAKPAKKHAARAKP